MHSRSVGKDGWSHLPLRVAPEVVDALVEEAERRYLSVSRFVELLVCDALPRLAAERVERSLRVVGSGPPVLASSRPAGPPDGAAATPRQGPASG